MSRVDRKSDRLVSSLVGIVVSQTGQFEVSFELLEASAEQLLLPLEYLPSRIL